MARPQGTVDLPIAKPEELAGPHPGDMLQFNIGASTWRPLLCVSTTEDGLVIGTLFLYAPEDRRSPWVLITARTLPLGETYLPPVLMHVVGSHQGNEMGQWRYRQ